MSSMVTSRSGGVNSSIRWWHLSVRGKVLAGIWICGLLAALFLNGSEVTLQDQRLYNDGMRKAEIMRDYELESDTQQARQRLEAARTWGWWLGFDSKQGTVVEQRRRELAPLDHQLKKLTAEREEVMRKARQQVGIWSEYGVSAVRTHFWENMDMAKSGATRQTKWDAFMMIIFDRESSFGEIIIRLLFQFFVNLFMYTIFGTISFLFSVYGVISLFAPSFIEGLAFFLVCAIAAGSVVVGFFAVTAGTVVSAGYAGVRLLINNRERQRLRQR